MTDIERLLEQADIQINGSRVHDIHVDPKDLTKLFTDQLSLGETFMDGVWTTNDLTQTYLHLTKGKVLSRLMADPNYRDRVQQSINNNLQTRSLSKQVIAQHYDVGNDLYQIMLGDTMSYTCAFWEQGDTLSQAQIRKMDATCRKLEITEGSRVLDLGCGFGSFARYAARNYGAEVTGITLSNEQADLARDLCDGLPVNIITGDYRDASGKYDAVVSLGMFEHIGHKNFRNYMKKVYQCLDTNGVSLIQTSGLNASQTIATGWIDKYIFPNGMLPSVQQIGQAMETLFVLEDWQNYSTNYYHTTTAWWNNVRNNWSLLKDKYDDRFYRMWQFYLLTSAAGFQNRDYNLWQIVMTKPQRTLPPPQRITV